MQGQMRDFPEVSACGNGDARGPALAEGSPAPLPVLAVGAVMVDAVCHVPRLPGSGEGVVVQSVSATLGGCALNSAAAVLDAGVPCRLFAPLGQGMFAGFVEQRLAELGLEAFRPPSNCGNSALPSTEAGVCADGLPTKTGILAEAAAPSTTNIPASFPESAQHDSGACVCFVEPDGQRTMVTLPGIERHFRDEWFAELDAECADSQAFSCALASGFEIGGAGGRAIVRFFERHPSLPLFFGPGPLLPTFPQELIDRLNALHPIWHLNDQEALEFTGCETLEDAGQQLADAAGNVCVITAGAQGSHAFFPKAAAPTSSSAAVSRATSSSADSFEEPLPPAAPLSASPMPETACDAIAPRISCGTSGVAATDGPVFEQRSAGRHIFVPSMPVPPSRIADTIGAGDTHLGALAAAYARGLNWEDALAAANEAAARVVQLPGGMLSIG